MCKNTQFVFSRKTKELSVLIYTFVLLYEKINSKDDKQNR